MRLQNPQLSELFKTPQRKTYTLSAITAITIGVFLLLALRPTFLKITELNKEIEDKRDFLIEVDDKVQTLNYLISERQSVSSNLSLLDAGLPSNEKAGFLIANFAAIAEQYDLNLSSVEFSDDVEIDSLADFGDVENISVVEVQITIKGTQVDIQRFINHLENFPRVINVISANYSKEKLSESEDDIDTFYPYSGTLMVHLYRWIGETDTDTELEAASEF